MLGVILYVANEHTPLRQPREKDGPVVSHEVIGIREGAISKFPSFYPHPELQRQDPSSSVDCPHFASSTHLKHCAQATSIRLNVLCTHRSPQLSQNRQRALEQIHIWIQLSSYALQQQDADNGVDEIALHLHMMRLNGFENFGEDVGNFDLTKGEGLGFDTKSKMLDL